MAKYGKLWLRIWSDRDFCSLDARAQQLYCLFISYPTRTAAGVLPLTLNRWANATADGTVENITNAIKQLAARRFVIVDWVTEEILVRTFIRNDEVFKQPNPMISALESVLHVQSPALRWALHYELKRLPDHKESERTLRVANELVEGISEPLAEGLAEPLAEPLTEGSVVVSYLSRDVATTNTTANANTPAPQPYGNGWAATPGAQMVREIVPREHPDATKTALRLQASELLNRGTDPDTVAAALQLWCDKPSVGIGKTILSSLCSEVIKTRTTTPRRATSDQRVLDAQALKAKYLADEASTPMGELA